ncbi:MAG: DUF459 domain-containing protein [Solirubrobacterales bacterium]|nr:DUF459 domain-containing protein [Solirubrobacterales bacterium]
MDEREHRREQLSDHQPIGGQPNVHDPAHPGIGDPADERLTMPAGKVLLIVVIAVLIAAIFNADAMVRAGEGMKPGTTRDVVLSVSRPLADVTGFLQLNRPREGFDLVFGQESKTASGTELETGSTEILKRKAKPPAEQKPTWPQPTRQRPLEVFVTGDSEADLVGLGLVDLNPDGLMRVETVARNGTALTNPGFFNWEVNAEQEMAARDPGAVVMLIGANDGFNVEVDGELFAPGTPEWETEFARRVAVVAETLSGGGKRPVYWVPPPTARDETYNEIYRSQNRAVQRAVESVEGARYVDIFNTINNGRYSDQIEIDGRKVLGRQSDGIHFNREGAMVPAEMVLEALAKDFPALEGGTGPSLETPEDGPAQLGAD